MSSGKKGSDSRVEILCECGTVFKAYLCSGRVACSRECANRRVSEWMKGEKNPSKHPKQRARMRNNNPMQQPEIAAVHGVFMTGDNNPSKRPEVRRKNSEAHIGKKNPEQSERMMGENNPNWKGGLGTITDKIRNSDEYKNWRISVFERDNYTCQDCGKRGCYLEAHHSKAFSLFPGLRLDITNGMTLCKDCHSSKPKGREILLMIGDINAPSQTS